MIEANLWLLLAELYRFQSFLFNPLDPQSWFNDMEAYSEFYPRSAREAAKSEFNNDGAEPTSSFAWNLNLYYIGSSKMITCLQYGIWGLFWYNDMGEMTQLCLRTGFVGATPKFKPLDPNSNWFLEVMTHTALSLHYSPHMWFILYNLYAVALYFTCAAYYGLFDGLSYA